MLREFRLASLVWFASLATAALAQQPSQSLTVTGKEQLPGCGLWQRYSQKLEITGGIPPYRWSLLRGALPHGLRLSDFGELTGIPDEDGSFEFTALVRDNENPPKQEHRKFVLSIESPLTIEWDQAARVGGQRIDGSIKVSNRTGRDFDLTMIVLAVNEIGRATAIGYQHFPLKKNVRGFSIPFGDTVSRAGYSVNVDVVGEEPVSKRIFRARLVTGKQQVSQGP